MGSDSEAHQPVGISLIRDGLEEGWFSLAHQPGYHWFMTSKTASHITA
jgi:hypothetical protein